MSATQSTSPAAHLFPRCHVTDGARGGTLRALYRVIHCCFWAIAALLPMVTVAQDTPPRVKKFIDIEVATPFEPAQAIGLLFSEQGTEQIPLQTPTRADESHWVARVPYFEEGLPRDTMATALLFANDGALAVGNIRPIFSPDARESFLSIPDCVPEKVTEATVQNQLSALESLVQIRSRWRGLSQVQVAQLMSDKFLERLRRLERGFGLTNQTELTPDLPPVQLIDRLSRILAAVQTVKGSSASTPKK